MPGLLVLRLRREEAHVKTLPWHLVCQTIRLKDGGLHGRKLDRYAFEGGRLPNPVIERNALYGLSPVMRSPGNPTLSLTTSCGKNMQ